MMRFLCVVCSSALLSSSLLCGPGSGGTVELQDGDVLSNGRGDRNSGPSFLQIEGPPTDLDFGPAPSLEQAQEDLQKHLAHLFGDSATSSPIKVHTGITMGVKAVDSKFGVTKLFCNSTDSKPQSQHAGGALDVTQCFLKKQSSTASSSDSGISSEGQSTPPLDTGDGQPYSWHLEQSQANTLLEPDKGEREGLHYACTQLLLKSAVVPPSTRARSSSVSTKTHAVSPLESSTRVDAQKSQGFSSKPQRSQSVSGSQGNLARERVFHSQEDFSCANDRSKIAGALNQKEGHGSSRLGRFWGSVKKKLSREKKPSTPRRSDSIKSLNGVDVMRGINTQGFASGRASSTPHMHTVGQGSPVCRMQEQLAGLDNEAIGLLKLTVNLPLLS